MKLLLGIGTIFFFFFIIIVIAALPKPIPFEQLPMEQQMEIKNISFVQTRDIPTATQTIDLNPVSDVKKLLDMQQAITTKNFQTYGEIFMQMKKAIK